MIRDYYAHVRFFANAKKIPHGLLNPPEANNGKGTFTLSPRNIYNIKICTFCDIFIRDC